MSSLGHHEEEEKEKEKEEKKEKYEKEKKDTENEKEKRAKNTSQPLCYPRPRVINIPYDVLDKIYSFDR